MKNIAASIARVARELLAEDEFTIITTKPMRFKPEGSTMNALANARMIADAGYGFKHGTVHFEDERGGIQSMEVFFQRGDDIAVHTFAGYNLGYSGEGPRGMVEFGKIFGLGLDPNKIFSPEYRASLQKKAAYDLIQLLG